MDIDAPFAAHDTAILVAFFSDFSELTTLRPYPSKGRKIGSGPGEVKSGERIPSLCSK
jgi:hypothetical protein